MLHQNPDTYSHKCTRKVGHLLFKISFKKAYEKVDWNFFQLTLKDFGSLTDYQTRYKLQTSAKPTYDHLD